MKKYVDYIFAHKKIMFIGFILLNLISIVGITQIKLNTDFALFTTNDTVYEDRLNEMAETFGDIEQIVVVVEHGDFTNDVKDDMREIQSYFEDMDSVTMVQGTAPEFVPVNNVEVPISQVDASILQTYFTNFEEFSALKEVDGVFYSVFTLFINGDFSASDVSGIEDYLNNYEYQSYISGDSYNQFKIVDYILSILFYLPPLTILVILLVFRWQIGAFKPTFLSVLPAAIGSLWTFGIIGFLGNEVSILTAVVPVFIIVIGSADGLHFMSHFQEALVDKMPRKEAMVRTLKVVGIPMIITTLTSMAGFLSLLSMNTSSIVDLAVFAALGIFLAGVATWYVLPLILLGEINVLPKHHHEKKVDLSSGLKKIWGTPSLMIVGVLLVFTVVFIGNINNEFDMLSVYKDYTVVAKNADKLQEVNGGSIPLYIEIEAETNVLSMASMNQVDDFATDLENLDEVDHVINPYRLIQIVYAVQVQGEIPNNFALNLIYTSLAASDTTIIDNIMNVDENKIRLLVFPTNMENDTLGVIEQYVEDSDQTAYISGVQYLLRDLNVSISVMQRNSILLAIGIVLIMLAISLKDIKIAVLSTLPIIITVGAIYGTLGITGIPLNITTVIIFSISIGVGIDYAVHFSSVYKMYLNERFSKKESVEKAYKDVSRPIIANALGISLGLSVLMLSPLTIHLYVSTLMWVGMVVSVFVTLTILPTIFKYQKRIKIK